MNKINTNNFWLHEQSEKNPNAIALMQNDTVITFSELYKITYELANFLDSKYDAANKRIGILSSNDIEEVFLIYALWQIKSVPVLISPKLSDVEINEMISSVGIRDIFLNKNLRYKNQLENIPNKFTFPVNIENHDFDHVNNFSFSINDPSLIVFTSGTTDKPKAIEYTFFTLMESARNVNSLLNSDGGNKWLWSLPGYHIGGSSIYIRALLNGDAVCIPESIKPNHIAEALDKFDPSYLSLVPTMLKRLREIKLSPNKNLKAAFIGGGPCEDELLLNALNAGWQIYKVYGSSETASMITVLKPEVLKSKINSAGIPFPNISISIRDKHDISLLANEIGEVCVQSDYIVNEYLNDANHTKEKFGDGFYHTGDFGYLDEDGFLYIINRREDMVVSGGENISISEVSRAISKIRTVSDFFLFGIEDKNWGQILCAAVKPVKGAFINEDMLRSELKNSIASYKIPKKFIFIDKIPRNELGKVKRKEIIKFI
ncbi:MAG: acyl--CoA ligase [Melioribacteraceae bacterium]|nr:acyl--CoA ligase [Melioribacteraceae bacterium]